MATFSSFVSILPVPSASNRSKASFMSVFCSSDSSNLGPVGFLRVPVADMGFFTAMVETEAHYGEKHFYNYIQTYNI